VCDRNEKNDSSDKIWKKEEEIDTTILISWVRYWFHGILLWWNLLGWEYYLYLMRNSS